MPTATDAVLLMRAICSSPEDDTPRLAYADLIQEQGDDTRAEFIRVQCELARIAPDTFQEDSEECYACFSHRTRKQHSNGKCLCTKRLRSLRIREAETCYPYVAEYLIPWASIKFTRGFPSHLTCTAEDFLTHAHSLCWHSSQTMVCGHCVGRRPSSPDAYRMVHPCRLCGGTGRVPAPFPDTAQPITHVTLTTMPTYFYCESLRDGGGYVDTPYPFLESSDEIKRRLEERFPGLTFTLPPIPAGYPDPNQTYLPHW
jgi:uncharacterized protein (TIGR02996 family)